MTAWSPAELTTLDAVFPRRGVLVAMAALPGRSRQAVNVMASKRGLRSPVVGDAPKPKLKGAELEEAIRLREEQAWSFARIGARFGVCEASACNAVLIELSQRQGFTPAQRDAAGRFTAEGKERLRLALRKGLKGVDIQLRLGLSASSISYERRRYQRDLKARGKAPLPQPGGGEAYSGVKLTRTQKSDVEALFMVGLGTLKIEQRTGVSKTSCLRIRKRMIARLKRKGENLPGCGGDGRRHIQVESSRYIAGEQIAILRRLLRERMPVQPAALLAGIGSCSAYRIRDELVAELAARGEHLPLPLRTGRRRALQPEPGWPPKGPSEIYRFRSMLRELGFDPARQAWIAEQQAEADLAAEAGRAARQAQREAAARPRSFEEQLEEIRTGKRALVRAFAPHTHLEPRYAEPERQIA